MAGKNTTLGVYSEKAENWSKWYFTVSEWFVWLNKKTDD